jgi:[ribosomal protein S5]-alanine N-acetyltransferase
VSEQMSPALVTARLIVRAPDVEDADRICAYYVRNKEHLSRWDPPAPSGFYDADKWRARLATYERERVAGGALRTIFLRCDDPDGEVVGVANLTQIARGPFLCASLGYSIDEAHEGNGYMLEALTALVAYAFGPLGLHRLQANYLPINERSGALLRRLGFVVEGYARDYLFINGAFRDHILTSLTNRDMSIEWAPTRS